jgi:hypothetical protein
MSCAACENAYRDEKLAVLETCIRRIANVMTDSSISQGVLNAQRGIASDLKAFGDRWNAAKCSHGKEPLGVGAVESIDGEEKTITTDEQPAPIKRGPGRPPKPK